jgi:hypothetical protein
LKAAKISGISLGRTWAGKFRRYNAHETERMRELDGMELASFASRAAAFSIDFLIAGALFLVVLVTVRMLLNR